LLCKKNYHSFPAPPKRKIKIKKYN
jgi:hypothetical protein